MLVMSYSVGKNFFIHFMEERAVTQSRGNKYRLSSFKRERERGRERRKGRGREIFSKCWQLIIISDPIALSYIGNSKGKKKKSEE